MHRQHNESTIRYMEWALSSVSVWTKGNKSYMINITGISVLLKCLCHKNKKPTLRQNQYLYLFILKYHLVLGKYILQNIFNKCRS